MIELKDLAKTYNNLVAVENLNLIVPKGEIFGFIGPNGAGKTTTINMIGGILAIVLPMKFGERKLSKLLI